MALFIIVCLIVALVLAILAGVPVPVKYNLLAWAFVAFVLSLLAPALQAFQK